jgi:uncharacterized protein (DUF1778 family)
MPREALESNQRLSLRIPVDDKALLVRAVFLQQTGLTEFMLRASVQAAREVIGRAERLALSERDSASVLELLGNPPQPNARLMTSARALPRGR